MEDSRLLFGVVARSRGGQRGRGRKSPDPTSDRVKSKAWHIFGTDPVPFLLHHFFWNIGLLGGNCTYCSADMTCSEKQEFNP